MSIFGSLEIGARGLGASQLALNVLGQNVSNANTEGYSRKRLELSADSRTDPSFGEMGFGVNVDKVARISDNFLELQIRRELTEQGFFISLDKGLERIENILTEPSDAGLNEAMDKFWASWQDLANNPEDPAAREVVRSTALVMEDKFHTLSRQFDELQMAQEADIEGKVEMINGMAEEIFNINEEIASMEISGGMANDGRDRRDYLMQELSKLIDVDTFEDEQGRLNVVTAGNVLVGAATVIKLELEKSTTTDESGELVQIGTIKFENTDKIYTPRGGELKGAFEMRDEIIPKFENFLDELASTFVESVNNLHSTGYNLEGNTGVDFFTQTNQTAESISLSASIRASEHNIAAATGGTSVGPINLASTIPAPTNQVIDLKTIDPNYRDIVQGSLQINMGSSELREGPGNDYVVDYGLGTVTFLNYNRYAGGEAIDVNFRYNSSGFSGPGDGSNALGIAQLRDQFTMGQDINGNPIKTMGEFYSSSIGVLGIERNQAKSNVETRGFLVNQFMNRKQEISGVSLDEELGDMIKFEHSYQASARFISTINKLLDTLLNM
ncbi:MAG: flagellar hook-associated protein FlgK [Fibrobacteria bacterium]|nr:flagellar hook-associated protein FlgK [Fibrobacteria bacterium]